jgi:hypothetical protein
MKTSSHNLPLPLTLLTLAALGLRLAYLNRPIYTDEAYTYLYFIGDGLADVLTDYREPNNHIFQTIFAWLAVTLGGNHPAMMRVPALIAGVALVPAVYDATRRLYNPRAALYTAALVTVSIPLAEYAVSARGYSFIALCFALQVSLAHTLKTHSSPRLWTTYGLLAALGLYTVPIMLYPFGAVSLWLLVSIWLENTGRTRWPLTRDMALTLASTALLTLALYTPVIVSNGLGALTDNPFVQPLSAAAFRAAVTGFPAAFVTFAAQGERLTELAMVALVVPVAVSLVAHHRLSDDAIPLLIPTVIWLALLVIVQYVLPPLRTWIFLLVLYPMLAGAGIDALLTWTLRTRYTTTLATGAAFALAMGLGGVVVATDALNNTLTYQREEDAREVAEYLVERFTEGDKILLTNGAVHNYEYYLDANGLPWDAVALTYPPEVVAEAVHQHTLYVLTRAGDAYVDDRLRESIGVGPGDVTLEPLATMPAGEIIVNRLVSANE